jgi:predicted aspartyl protease
MTWELSFDQLHCYDAGKPGITVPITLQSGMVEIDLDAKLDTGSSDCVFQRAYGETLGFDIESGYPQHFGTATGSFLAYGHAATLTISGFDFDAIVYFAEDESFNRNVVGRNGFLNRVRLGLIDYEGKLFLSRFGDNGSGV